MWMLFVRAPVPDSAYWPGRRLLAVADSILWPTLVWALAARVPGQHGLVLPVLAAVCVVTMLARVRTAVWANHRYTFTTWKLGRLLLLLLVVAFALKLALAWH